MLYMLLYMHFVYFYIYVISIITYLCLCYDFKDAVN